MRCGVPSALYSTVTWLLASGRRNFSLPLCRRLGVVLDEPVGQVDRQRHQGRRLVAGEAEHHALVAGPADVDAHGRCAATCAWTWQIDLAGVGREARSLGIGVADLADDVADELVDGLDA